MLPRVLARVSDKVLLGPDKLVNSLSTNSPGLVGVDPCYY